MPKSKSRNKSALRKQDIMSAPTKVFKELYFTKSAMKYKAIFANYDSRRKLTAKEECQIAGKLRYVVNPESVLWRKTLEGGKPGTGRTRQILHFRH